MGSHGPSYSQRYPDRFEDFKPVCQTTELGRCTRDEIVNAYDNRSATPITIWPSRYGS